MNKKSFFILSFFLLLYANQLVAQKNNEFADTCHKRNVIKWNLTPMILFSKKNINFSYERVLKPYRTFSINSGYFELSFDGLFDSLFVNQNKEKSGFSFAGDYRFYFNKRNKGWAPDGLYWGVYSSYHHYQFDNTINFVNRPDIQGSVEFGGKLNVFSAGAELGYQFIIKDRFSIDLIFIGPSLSAYQRKFTLGGNVDKQNEYLEAIWDALKEKFPYFREIAESGILINNETTTHMGLGMRYVLQIGYTF